MAKPGYKKIPAILQRIAEINRECFLKEDDYSTAASVSAFVSNGGNYFVVKSNNVVVGYALYKEYADYISSVRVGVMQEYQGRGKGTMLLRRLAKLSRSLQKDIYTYTSVANLLSLNLHLKHGYRIYGIEELWVRIFYPSS